MINPTGIRESKRPSNRLTWLLIVASSVIATALLYGLYKFLEYFRSLEYGWSQQAACRQDIEDVAGALRQYAKAHSKFPKSANWQEEVKAAYLEFRKESDRTRSATLLGPLAPRMDREEAWGCTFTRDGVTARTGFALNERIAGKPLTDITSPRTTVLVFEIPTVKKSQVLAYQSQMPNPYHDLGPKPDWWKVEAVAEGIRIWPDDRELN